VKGIKSSKGIITAIHLDASGQHPAATMEVAGVILGGIPLVLYAIDNYHRCLQATADYWRYEGTLKLLRSHIFVQQQQLQITLRSIGLVEPTPFELEEYLRHRYPDKHDVFMDIIAHMEKLLAKLMDKLDIDSKGRVSTFLLGQTGSLNVTSFDSSRCDISTVQPRWTTESPERAVWEWRRVRRGFGRSSRQRLITELQFWNDALKNCLDKTELPLDNDTPTSAVESIRVKFSPAECNKVRQRALQIHRAMSRAWQCDSHEHQGNLKISWHTDNAGSESSTNSRKMRLIFGSWDLVSPTWYEVACDVVDVQTSATAASRMLTAAPAPCPPASHASVAKRSLGPSESNPRPWKRMKDWFQSPSASREAGLPLHPRSRVSEAHPDVALAPQEGEVESPSEPEVSCVCSFLHSATRLGRLGLNHDTYHASNGDTLHVRMERLWDVPVTASVRLDAALDRSYFHSTGLSRKDRFAAAAASTWAVLYLAGSP
jgi:hypothetical protein